MMGHKRTGDDAGIAEHPVGLITVSYHSAAVLTEMLRSVARASPSLAAVTIADNASEDQVRELALAAGYEYLALPNRGYGAAINAAAATLSAGIEWIVISNPDVILEPDTVAELLKVGRSDDTIAAVGPKILDEDGSIYPSARAIPSLRVGIGHALFSGIWHANPWTRAYKLGSAGEMNGIRDAGWLSGACLLVRRSAFDEIGGFDETFFMYFEDVDLGFRLGKAGYRNVYAPTARVVHSGGHSTSAESDRMIDAHHSSARLFVARKYPGAILAPLRGVIGVGLRLRAAFLKRAV